MKVLQLICLGLVPAALGVHIPNPNNPDFNRLSWGYTALNGPATWPANFETCNGDFQSPIAIRSDSAQFRDVGKIEHFRYDEMMMGKVLNNQHTIKFTFDTSNTANNPLMPYITGDRYGGDRYQFLQLHWHWGSISSRGSEHTLNGREYPAELHLVHWNTKYSTVTNALSRRDGLAVLGFFYEVSSTDNADLGPILQASTALPGNTSASVSSAIKLSSLLPSGQIPERFYTYEGGLTTPTCDEVVQWTVFDTTIKISEAQLQILRQLTDSNGVTLNDNYRPPQNVRRFRQNNNVDRVVFLRTPPTTSSADTAALAKASGVAIGSVMGALLTAVFLGLFSSIGGKKQPSHDDYYQAADGRYYSHTVQPQPDLFSGNWLRKVFG